VAILLCLVVFFTGSISGFIMESFDTLSENISKIYYYTVKPIVHLLPQFDRHSPTKFMINGRLLSWLVLAKVAGVMVFIKSTLLLGFGLLIFSYREIAKVII